MRIAILTLGTRGDVQPYVALAKEAIKQGHSALICTGKSFEKLITENGIEFAQTQTDLMAMLESEEGKMIMNGALKHPLKTKKYLDTIVNPAFRRTLDQFWQAVQGSDLILYHPKAFGAVDMAQVLKIPCVSMPPVPITYPIEEFPNLAISPTRNLGSKINKWTYTIMAKAESASIKQVNDFRQNTLKLPQRKAGEYTFKVDGKDIPIIYPISRALLQDVKSWEDKVYLPGFFYLDMLNERLDEKIKNFIDSGKPPIIISFSSMPLKNPSKFKDKLIEALKNTNNRGIVLTGISGLHFENSEDILAVKGAPHNLLFPFAKGIVHHGGVGTMAATLQSGKPQLIIPFSVDQPFWANRLYKMGYALKPIVEKTLTVKDLEDRFIEMDEETNIRKAKEIGNIINKENGTSDALKYLETIYKNHKGGI